VRAISEGLLTISIQYSQVAYMLVLCPGCSTLPFLLGDMQREITQLMKLMQVVTFLICIWEGFQFESGL
jgi:hypothetical protein